MFCLRLCQMLARARYRVVENGLTSNSLYLGRHSNFRWIFPRRKALGESADARACGEEREIRLALVNHNDSI